MYFSTIYLVGKQESFVLKTEQRKLVRALMELSLENDTVIKVNIEREVAPTKAVKFKGI